MSIAITAIITTTLLQLVLYQVWMSLDAAMTHAGQSELDYTRKYMISA